MSVFIIAEAGINHNGCLKDAFKLVDAAVSAKADAIKFQTFRTDSLVTQYAEKADYQKSNSSQVENQYAMLKRLELSFEDHLRLKEYCSDCGILFLSTAFDFDSLDFLVNDIGVEFLKVSSGEITNGPFLLAHAKTGKKIILSTGMSTLGEVETALAVLAFAYLQQAGEPSMQAFQQAYCSKKGREILTEKVTLLHCTSEYPAPIENINLLAMDTLKQSFALPVGYSDHSEGITLPIAAAARGATLIEKHFTLDKRQCGPDHKVSLEPDELKLMVAAIRDVEKALGSSLKYPGINELKNQKVVRKSLVAKQSITPGALFTEDNLAIKRSGAGVSPMQYWSILGAESVRSYEVDDLI